MASLEGFVGGAQAGAELGPWGSIGLGLLGGLFGGKQKLSPEQRFQMNIARDMQRFSKSAPLSDPGERAALAEQRAQLGEQQRNQQQGLYSMLSPNVTTAPADMAQSIAAQNTSQQMALQAQSMMQALQDRRQALLQAAGVAQGVGPRQEVGGGLAPMLGQMAQMYTQYQAAKQGQTQYQQLLDALTGKTARAGGVSSNTGAMNSPQTSYGMNAAMDGALHPKLQMPSATPQSTIQGMGVSRGMPTQNMGNNIPMQPPQGVGYGVPSNNSMGSLQSPDLYSKLKPQFGFPQLLGSGVR